MCWAAVEPDKDAVDPVCAGLAGCLGCAGPQLHKITQPQTKHPANTKLDEIPPRDPCTISIQCIHAVSVIKDKFSRVDQGPHQILDSLLALGLCRLDRLNGDGPLACAWPTAVNQQVNLIDNLAR